MRHVLVYVNLVFLLLLASCTGKSTTTASVNDACIRVENGQFVLNGKPYYFIGTNFWYGPLLGSQGVFGDRDRLIRELDFLKEKGVNNLRVLVGADGPNGVPSKVMPSLQESPGHYEQSVFDGLEVLMKKQVFTR